MTNKNYQTSVYTEGRDLKQHEVEMLNLIKSRREVSDIDVLDIGCADGHFLAFLKSQIRELNCTGIDLSQELIERASNNHENIDFYEMDATNIQGLGQFDIIIASGILSVFEDPEEILENWLALLKETGKLFIFGRFNSADIDTIIRFRVGDRSSPWEGGWTSFSIKSFSEIIESLGWKTEFKKFQFDGTLPKTSNPVQTFTVESVDGEKYMMTGGNIAAEHFFVVVSKDI